MFRLSIACPIHNLPYQYITLTPNSQSFLKCKNCPQESNLIIATQLQYMRARMGSQKTKQRQRIRQRSKSKSQHESVSKEKGMIKHKNKYKNLGDQLSKEEEQEMNINKKIAEQQVVVLQLVMKLLTEDKKKHFQNLDKSINQHKKLWVEYSQSIADIKFLNKMIENCLIENYIKSLSKKGWDNLKQILIKLYNRTFLCKKIINQSVRLIEQIKKQSSTNEQTLLRNLQLLLNNSKNSKLAVEKVMTENKKISNQHIHKRSKSFGIFL